MITPDDFRRLALGLEDAIEGAHMGHPDFRANGRIFASLHTNDRFGMVKLTPDEQRVVMRSDPNMFEPSAGAWGRQGCTNVRLESAEEGPVRAALILAWEHAVAQPAPRKRTPKPRAPKPRAPEPRVAKKPAPKPRGATARASKPGASNPRVPQLGVPEPGMAKKPVPKLASREGAGPRPRLSSTPSSASKQSTRSTPVAKRSGGVKASPSGTTRASSAARRASTGSPRKAKR